MLKRSDVETEKNAEVYVMSLPEAIEASNKNLLGLLAVIKLDRVKVLYVDSYLMSLYRYFHVGIFLNIINDM